MFKLLILKYFDYKDKLNIIDYNKVRIIIEIPNTYIDYMKKYKILKYLKEEKNLKIKEENEILLKNNNKVQFVANILKMYNNDEIKSKSILPNNEDKEKEGFERMANIEPNELNSLINKALIDNIEKIKHLKNYHPNFYQKNIFINLLYSEFYKFMKCHNLNPKTVDDVYNLLGNLRKEIIMSLIENSIFFTFTQFDKIINKESNNSLKIENNKIVIQNYQSDEDKKNSIQ